MSSIREVIGARFCSANHGEPYFLAYMCGNTEHKHLAYVYTHQQVMDIRVDDSHWASKKDGKWELVYATGK